MTKEEIAAPIQGLADLLMDQVDNHQDAALVSGAFLATAIRLYRNVGGTWFAAEVLRGMADEIMSRELPLH